MTHNNTWATPAAISWIEKILSSRFGHEFTLKTTPQQTIKITHTCSSNFIELSVETKTFLRNDSDLSCSHWNSMAEGWNFALKNYLPAPGLKALPSPLIEKIQQGFHIHYDLLGLTYWMLSRQEEVGRKDLDQYGRFTATSSHAFKHDYLERPIVDEWLHILGQVINIVWPALSLKNQRFRMEVSHDVDEPSRYAFRSLGGIIRAIGGDILKRRDLKHALLAPWIRTFSKTSLHPSDPANTFDWIMDISERHGLKSAFYFICGRTDVSKDADYEIEHPAIRQLLRKIHTRGHEIGLHPSFDSYKKPEIISAEAERLRRVAAEEQIVQNEWGGRMHYLRWEHPTTLQAWEKAGMAYDSTLGYADRPGFRCGTCFEYPAFDVLTGNILNLRIRPLISMEGSIISENYMALGSGEAAQAKFLELKHACRSVDGVFTMLWHNSQLNTASEKSLYSSIF